MKKIVFYIAILIGAYVIVSVNSTSIYAQSKEGTVVVNEDRQKPVADNDKTAKSDCCKSKAKVEKSDNCCSKSKAETKPNNDARKSDCNRPKKSSCCGKPNK